MTDRSLNPATLLSSTDLRLTLHASLKPAAGLDRFQPAGFPEIGHVIYDAPRACNRVQKVCIVDSAASMANHLETVCLASEHSLELADELAGMPYVECRTDSGWPNVADDDKRPEQLVATTLSEGHRLASTYFLDGVLVSDGKPGDEKFGTVLRNKFGIADLGKKSHPLPEQWWTVFTTIFGYDPNSLVHGVLFPAMGIKLPRMLTAHLEAFDAARVRSSGVKFDKLGKTSSGQPIFSVDEETASEIIATFVIDLALLRSFGREDRGLNSAQKEFLLTLALWKIERLLRGPFRYRSNCDLELDKLLIRGCDEPAALPAVDIKAAIEGAEFRDPPVTTVYWPAEELFRTGADERDEGTDSDEEQDT
ncbi:MAG: CRISPR-associated protein [Gammaproteobacteria bacterium]|nr:CRISPR-associated protein [Gammaproteobacteria bacterium]